MVHSAHAPEHSPGHWVPTLEAPKSTTAATLLPARAVAVPPAYRSAGNVAAAWTVGADEATGTPARFCNRKDSNVFYEVVFDKISNRTSPRALVRNQHTRELITLKRCHINTTTNTWSPTVTLTWHACKCKVAYINSSRGTFARVELP